MLINFLKIGPGLRERIAALMVLCAVLLLPGIAHAWPSASDWIPLVNASGYVGDPDSDYSQCHLDVVGDSSLNPAAMVYNDGTYIYYRIRLDCSPSGPGGVKQNTWGLLIDTDMNADSYEWMVRIDGRPTDSIIISQNTSQGTLGDPSDSAEVDVWVDPLNSTPGSENYKITSAGTNFPVSSPDPDYWLEFRYPYDVWLFYMGLDDSSVIRYFIGTGPSGRTFSGDIVGTSLYTDLTNPVLPTGTEPTTGYVMFVADLTGNGDITEAYPGDTLYIKVDDPDQNDQKTLEDTIEVVVNTPAGDSEILTLTETGLNTGIFTGSILTADSNPAISNGLLDLSPIETVRVTYVDAVDALLNKNRDRYDSLTALPSADIGISKAVDNYTPNEGDTVSFTLTLHNYGTSDASGLQVADILPSGLIYNSDSGGGGYNPTNGIWTVASILDGQTLALVINATVDSGTSGQTIVNNADITYNPQTDPDSTNDSASVVLTVQGSDLEVMKSVDSATPNEGDSIVYTITLTNNGSNDATGIIVNDVLPAGLTYVSSSPSAGAYDQPSGIWNGFGLLSGANATLDITASVNAGTTGTVITNFANVVSADQADPVQANNSDSASIAVGGVDLLLNKQVDIPTPDVGQVLVFTVTLLNNSTNTATLIEVSDIIPSGLNYVFAMPLAGSYNPATGIWSGFSLSAGASATLYITVTVNSGTGGDTIVNTSQVTSVTQTDIDLSNNSASASVTVKAADLSIIKSVDNQSPDPSAEVVFTVTLTNNGPDTATGVEVTDTLSAGLTYVSDTPSAGSFDSVTGIWSGLTLAAGASETLLVNATVPGTSGSVETNTATVTASDREDNVPGNDSDIASITVGGIDLEVVKTVDNPAPAEGSTITYTVVVNNVGDFPATGIQVIDTLPAGINYSSYSASQGTYKWTNGIWKTLSIANGASATLSITATVNAGTNGSTIENTARILTANEPDINITNNLDKALVYVGSTDLGVSKIVDNPVPTEGDTVSFTVTVTNNGLNNATDVLITDLLSSELTYDSDDAGAYYDSATGIWNVTTPTDTFMLPGSTRTLIVNATVNAGTYGKTVINYAEITGVGQLDPDATNDIASASITIQGADIALLKVGDDATPAEGQVVSFTITATNYGPHAATGVIVKDLLPAGLTYSADDSGGLYNSVTGIWSVGSIAKLASATLVVNATADVGTGGSTITNIANVVSADQFDPGSLNNTSSFGVSPLTTPSPDIRMNKTVLTFWDPVNLSSGNQKAIPGAVMIYNLNVSNEGDGSPDSGSLVITEMVPANTEMYVDDLGGVFPGPVDFVDGLVSSGLGIASVVYSNDGGGTYLHVPVSTGGYDASVTNFKVTLSGVFNVSDGISHPYFDIKFRVRVK